MSRGQLTRGTGLLPGRLQCGLSEGWSSTLNHEVLRHQGLITLKARLVLMGYSQSQICGHRQKVLWIFCTAGISQCLSQPTFESQANQIIVGVVNNTQVSTWCSKIKTTLVKSVTVLIWFSDVAVYDVAVLQAWPHLQENTHHREEPFVLTSNEK